MLAEETVSWVSVTTTKDNDGGYTTTEAAAVDVRALVAGLQTAENVDPLSPALIVGMTLYLRGTTVIPGPSDWFTVRGARFDVDGEPFRWASSGIQITVRRAGATP